MSTVSFWSWQFVAAMCLGGIVQCLTIGAYASRIAGAASGRVATALSLFNIFTTAGRFASMLYTPILGSLSDAAGLGAIVRADHAIVLSRFEWQLRFIVLAAAVGTACGTILLPTFFRLYLRAIKSYELRRSVPKSLLRLLLPGTAMSVIRSFRLPAVSSVRYLKLRNIPVEALVLNTLVTSVYGIGVIAAVYASVLNPAVSRTALLSSGLINGFATVAYNLVVDPSSAFITDEAVKGERPIADVKSMIVLLGVTGTVGFLLSQVLLVPAAVLLEGAARALTGN